MQREKRVSISRMRLVFMCDCLCVSGYRNPPRWLSVEGECVEDESSIISSSGRPDLSFESFIDHLLLGHPVLSFTFICSCESYCIHSLSYIYIQVFTGEGWVGFNIPSRPWVAFRCGASLGGSGNLPPGGLGCYSSSTVLKRPWFLRVLGHFVLLGWCFLGILFPGFQFH